MKPKILTILLSGIICCPIYAFHWTFHYNPSTLSFKNDTTEYGVFEKVLWADASSNGAEDVGMPELPAFYHSIKIEDNVIIDTVKITLSNGTSGFLTNPIMPRQHPIPTGCPTGAQLFVKNESVYQKNEIFPHNCLIDYHVNHARDGKFLSLIIVPFQYNPATNAYTAYSVVEVEVLTHEENNQIRELRTHRDIGLPYFEYVIITSPHLISAFEPFAEWKRAKGYNVGIVNINDILNNPYLAQGDEISDISDNAGKLRQYLINAYDSVQTKYVLLGGDSTIIPIRYAFDRDDSIPTDFYYAELNCNWDANHNGKYGENSDYVDYGSEVYVGRLLCAETEEVKNWTKKVLQYEINPGNGDYSYLGRALITQSDLMQNYHQAENIRQQLQGHIDVTILSEVPNYLDSFPTAPLGHDIIETINNMHYGLLSNFNHGGPLSYAVTTYGNNVAGDNHNHVVGAMDSYDSESWTINSIAEQENGFENLTNSVYPAIFYSTSCTNMPFDMHGMHDGTYNLGRVFTCKSNGGGPAYLGNTRDVYISPSFTMYKYFLDSILTYSHLNHLGIAEAKSKIKPNYNYIRHSHNLLGCPEMSLYTQIPNIFDNIAINHINNHITVSTGVDSTECRICLSGKVNGTYRQFVYTDRSNVTFDTIPETYTLVVSMPNYIPYIWTNDTCLLQNQHISDSRTYNGCDIFNIGSDITPMQPYGNVTIENGGNVEINVGDRVVIKNGFEVKLGGHLLIH